LPSSSINNPPGGFFLLPFFAEVCCFLDGMLRRLSAEERSAA
jgi:hypothetical protein